jgi:hypothetical protein
MADIDVVPKRRTNMWVWILLAIVIVAILWMALGSRPATTRTGRIGGRAPAPVYSLLLAGPSRAS